MSSFFSPATGIYKSFCISPQRAESVEQGEQGKTLFVTGYSLFVANLKKEEQEIRIEGPAYSYYGLRVRSLKNEIKKRKKGKGRKE